MKILGLSEFRRSLKLLKTEVRARVDLRLTALAALMADKARELAPVETGKLRENIKLRKEHRGRIAVIAEAPYSGFVEFGTRPHEIRPRHKKVLRFEINGKIVFATRVYHPGTSPKPFFRPALEDAVEKLPEIFNIWEVIE